MKYGIEPFDKEKIAALSEFLGFMFNEHNQWYCDFLLNTWHGFDLNEITTHSDIIVENNMAFRQLFQDIFTNGSKILVIGRLRHSEQFFISEKGTQSLVFQVNMTKCDHGYSNAPQEIDPQTIPLQIVVFRKLISDRLLSKNNTRD